MKRCRFLGAGGENRTVETRLPVYVGSALEFAQEGPRHARVHGGFD